MLPFISFVGLLALGLCVNGDYFETHFDDGLVANATDQLNRNALRSDAFRWPDAEVPYRFSDEYDEGDRRSVREAMDALSADTCVRFVPASGPEHAVHVTFVRANGCGSHAGYMPGRPDPHTIALSAGCLRMRGAIQHEIMHILGLLHEQARPDRDEYVRVLWDNVRPEFVNNFRKCDRSMASTFGLPYDYDSLMHYPRDAFARSGQNVTMYALHDPDRELGQSDGPTFIDLEKIRRMYKC